ncbi:Protein CBG21204 [Caenorhabditis briggsae]|uniref:Protein CBG21204 n=1 Tax=Caenorhabditis briggsae TaxID=6238 RepID=A8XZL8_CAEBR|nr:Protein CBG21204 [Caenorhabditis briggsae]CAP38017.2 Protein CBG21204 [Caenorhabditis briggsae]
MFKDTVILLLICLLSTTKSSNLIEDITDKEVAMADADDHLQTFPTPPPIGTTTSSGDALFTRMNEILRKEDKQKSQNFQIFNEQDLVTNSNSNPYFSTTRKPKNRSDSMQKARDPDGHNQVIAGIPDLSDPCFRRYENSIVVNAQPYERRSSTGLIHCKSHCLNSQIGVYTCRSFVYDNVNRFQTRDYFEPTDIVHCLSIINKPSEDPHTDSDSEDVDPPSPPPPSSPIKALATNTDTRDEKIPEPQNPEDVVTSSESLDTCPRGKQSTFLRTEGFELFKHDEQEMVVEDVAECAKACIENKVNGVALTCKSFDFLTTTSTCSFTSEAAVPVGNGQLKQKDEASYHEKICVSKDFVETCPSTFFSRHPQMILVGFAESVSDSPSFEHCFDTCINSYQLFGFNCTSGMYYFEENQLNCILNSENRNTQSELFTEENTDIVDYFEVECTRPKTEKVFKNEKCRESEILKIEDCAEEVRDCEEPIGMKLSIRRSEDLEDSGVLKNGENGEEVNGADVEEEEDPVPTKEEIAEVKQKIRRTGFKCPLNECCQVFMSCSYGLRHNSHTKQLEWCRRPCSSEVKSFRRSRLLRR